MGKLFHHSNSNIDDGIYRFLSDDGTSSGTKNVNLDHSVGNQDYYIEAPAGEHYGLTTMHISIRDAGTLDAGGFGNGPILPNGINFWVKDDQGATVKDMNDGVVIQANSCLSRYAHEILVFDFGSGDNFINTRWNLTAAGRPLLLYPNWKFGFTAHDSFTFLVSMYMYVKGTRGTMKAGISNAPLMTD